MVIGHDPSFIKDQKNQVTHLASNLGAASRLDRLAANVIDFFIVFSLAKVFASKPLLALKIAFSFDLSYTVFANLFNVIWLSFSVYLIYVVITYRFIGCSLGQYFFSLRIVHDDPSNLTSESDSKFQINQISHFTLVLRTVLSFISLLMVFPIIGIFINPRGKSFFDKVCDTLVITTRKNAKRIESSIPIHSLVSSLLVLMFFSLASLTSLYFMKKSFHFETDFSNNSKVCEQISTYHRSWTKNDVQDSRLDVALALYSAGELSVECLTKEIDFEFSVNPNNPTAYFAKGLLSFENEDSVIKYFKKSCKLDVHSPACSVSSWISLWPNFLEGESLEDDSSVKPIYYKVWLVKRYHQKGMISKLSKYLQDFKMQSGLESFYTENLMRVKIFQEKESNFGTVLKLISGVGDRDHSLIENYCGVLISDSCARFESSTECSSLKMTKSSDSHLKNMKHACLKDENKIFSSNLEHEIFYKTAARSEAYILEDLKNIFMDSKNKFGIRLATLNRFFDFVTNVEYLNLVKEEWEMESSKDFFWRLTGEKLKSKYILIGETQKSFEIYKSLSLEFNEIRFKDNLQLSELGLRLPAQIDIKATEKRKKGN